MNKFIKIGGSGGATSYGGLTDKATVDLPTINTPLAAALNGKEAAANKKTDVDVNKTSDTFFPTVKAVYDWAVGLFVRGAASSTDNTVVRWDGPTGKLVQNSNVVIADNGSTTISGDTNVKLSVTGNTASTADTDIPEILVRNMATGGQVLKKVGGLVLWSNP